MKQCFESFKKLVPPAKKLTATHCFGEKPEHVFVDLICLSKELNYEAGDVVTILPDEINLDDTQVEVHFNTPLDEYKLASKPTKEGEGPEIRKINPGKWEYRIRIYS